MAEVAEIRGGFVPSAAEARQRKRREEEGALPGGSGESDRALGLQPSAVRSDGTIAWEEAVAVLPIRGADRYTIREGELLLPLRSQQIQAVIARDVPGRVLATGQWALIAPNARQADTDYLAWYLNHPRTRARLAATMVGTSLQFLTLATVRDFELELPTIDVQQRIGRVAALNAHVGQLERQLASAREKLIDTVTMAALERTA